MQSASSASQLDQELSIIFNDSCLDPFEELDIIGALFKLVGSILQGVRQRLIELLVMRLDSIFLSKSSSRYPR